MRDELLTAAICDWLVEEAFGEPDLVALFDTLCARLCDSGIPISRAILAWPTLHPLIDTELVLWHRDSGIEHRNFPHDYSLENPDWINSPIKHVIDHQLPGLRRRLAGPGAMLDFPFLEELAARGCTDYFLISTAFAIAGINVDGNPAGVIASWATDHPGGFTDADIATLTRVKRSLALTCKTVGLSRIARNIADAYLGRVAADHVLSGRIRRGDGEIISAVVWYCDLRDSTGLAATMARSDYLAHLNRYFECTAGAAIAAGGEVLDFIGDAVLAIFPFAGDDGLRQASARACAAIAEAEKACAELDADTARPLAFGIGLSAGEVLFGNIGVPQRLTFSVIGTTVNEVARIEKATKGLSALALATAAIAEATPENWRSVGSHSLAGVAEPVALYAWRSRHERG